MLDYEPTESGTPSLRLMRLNEPSGRYRADETTPAATNFQPIGWSHQHSRCGSTGGVMRAKVANVELLNDIHRVLRDLQTTTR
ncbi:hypothetical protein GTS_18060 [Gandjariella thermophila]|uniref:Uncharacterized protein n=1 Tax=Gandjariella thermophila TaxID=1931992 RepID=A0A4D4J8H2_9PSEU|nr:hypothetical protein GTS_18060 [Gandjariella thermophila]